MKANILDINGKKTKTIDLPKCFSKKVREDIVMKIIETQKNIQPYGPSPVAGKQHAAKGKVVHRRHVWRSGYGRGSSRVPLKIFSQKGSQFNWEAAEVPNARGGMRAHPPKPASMVNTKTINKKELKLGLISAISATAMEKKILKRYATLNEKIENLPLVTESKLTTLKTKDLISSIKKILGKELYKIAEIKKSVRPGKGKLRGRKYKKNAGLLIVIGKKEKLKTNSFDIQSVNNLGVTDLAKGGSGRLTLYTEEAIKDLGEKFK
ncbi:50S ribosomal protein L4 [Candidatus Pacearchaeota archaeon]|nr:50S ribosomal protein L4 [Candidatus Pacearchaeota archaeon]